MSHLPKNAFCKVGNRAERYTQKELRFLLSEVQRYPNIIESPSSHSETKNRKILLWQHISMKLQRKFPSSSPRSALQLRNWWKRTKSRAKQRLAHGQLTSGKYSDGCNKKFPDNTRGRQVLSEYTVQKEDSEFANFLEEASDRCATYESAIFCESLRSDELEDSIRLGSTGAEFGGNTILTDYSGSETSPKSIQLQNVTSKNNYGNQDVSLESIYSCDKGGMLSNSQNFGESTSQDCTTALMFNQIMSIVVLFLSNYKCLLQNSDSFNPTKTCTPENNLLETKSKDNTNAKKDCGETCAMTFVSSSSSSIIRPKLGNTNSQPEKSKLLLELMQIDNEILRLKRRKQDLQLIVSKDYINNYMENLNVPEAEAEFDSK
uniref:SANT domain-containing protein n=1 Tax=Trichobilharzia regenti TaxID=157069 RepID=A0AA85JCU9_TRIRE|nr:unnamed protein product [Trichobilharzia regenti]